VAVCLIDLICLDNKLNKHYLQCLRWEVVVLRWGVVLQPVVLLL
jgi:hypothetical protein